MKGRRARKIRTENFLEGFDECRDRIISILRLEIPIEEKLKKIQHLAEFPYYERYDPQDKFVEDPKN